MSDRLPFGTRSLGLCRNVASSRVSRSTSDMESSKLSRSARRRLPAVRGVVGIVGRNYHRRSRTIRRTFQKSAPVLALVGRRNVQRFRTARKVTGSFGGFQNVTNSTEGPAGGLVGAVSAQMVHNKAHVKRRMPRNSPESERLAPSHVVGFERERLDFPIFKTGVSRVLPGSGRFDSDTLPPVPSLRSGFRQRPFGSAQGPASASVSLTPAKRPKFGSDTHPPVFSRWSRSRRSRNTTRSMSFLGHG
jgi:hypothetical protein